jgi:hypothetical protein
MEWGPGSFCTNPSWIRRAKHHESTEITATNIAVGDWILDVSGTKSMNLWTKSAKIRQGSPGCPPLLMWTLVKDAKAHENSLYLPSIDFQPLLGNLFRYRHRTGLRIPLANRCWAVPATNNSCRLLSSKGPRFRKTWDSERNHGRWSNDIMNEVDKYWIQSHRFQFYLTTTG